LPVAAMTAIPLIEVLAVRSETRMHRLSI
jgi:hypothetical protein